MELTRTAAEASAADLTAHSAWKAAKWTFSHEGRRFLVKDVRRCAWLYRFTIGRWTLAREARFYRRLQGVPFVPTCIGQFDADSLVLERVPGVSLKRLHRLKLSPAFFGRLQACVDELHARGILHLDLRQPENILVTPAGQPLLVDFETALYLGTGPLSRRLLIPLLAFHDRSAVLKFRLLKYPDQVTPEEKRRYRCFLAVRALWPRNWLEGTRAAAARRRSGTEAKPRPALARGGAAKPRRQVSG